MPTPCPRTILVVDDEPTVRDLVRRLLELDGHRVAQAGSGDEAIEWIRANGTFPELLLTDIIMPGLSGVELAGALTKAHPQLKVVYMSGYSKETLVALDQTIPRHHPFLQKPFRLQDLDQALTRAFSATEPHSSA